MTLRAVVLGGTSAAVIAYGQTGSGKTYQMQARLNFAHLLCAFGTRRSLRAVAERVLATCRYSCCIIRWSRIA